MQGALALLLVVAIIIGGFFYWRMDQLSADKASLEASLESQEEKFRLQEEAYERQAEAMEDLRESHAEAVAERDRYLKAFDGGAFEEALVARPEYYEERINRASGKVIGRLEEASGLLVDEETPQEAAQEALE